MSDQKRRMPHELIADPPKALALAVLLDAIGDKLGRRWIRTDRMALVWCDLADVEHIDLVSRADEIDGYKARRCA